MAKIEIDDKCKSKRKTRIESNGKWLSHGNGEVIRFRSPESARRYAAEKRIQLD